MSQKTSTRSNGTKRIQDMNQEPTRTQQNAKDECDVNKIIGKYKKTGIISHVSRKQTLNSSSPTGEIDVSNIPDFYQAMQTVADATSLFNQLPANLRKRFGNDPGEMLTFLADSKNNEEAIKLGLKDPPQKQTTPSQQTQTPNQQTQTQNQNNSTQTQQTQQTTITQPTNNPTQT